MIDNLFSAITRFLLSIVLWISNLIIGPIYFLISKVFPDLSSFLDTAGDFFDEYIITGIAFFKEVFFNITGFPRALLSAVVLYYTALYSFKVARRGILFLYRSLIRVGLIH